MDKSADVTGEAPAGGGIYRFGQFTLDLRRGTLASPNRGIIALRRKAFALLRLFVERSGQVLDHDTIMRAVWPGVIVTDESIAQCVREIRRTLGGEARSFIKTVPRRGYLFAIGVSRLNQVASRSAAAARIPRLLGGRPTLAIAHVTSLDGQDVTGGAGVLEEVLVELAQSRTVTAVPCACVGRATDRDLMDVACQGGAQYLLLIAVRRDAARIRLTARVLELPSGAHLWGKGYDREGADTILWQEEVSCSVARDVEISIGLAEQKLAFSSDRARLGPWMLLQRGLWHLGRNSSSDNRIAADYFRQVSSIAPDFATPHAALALALFNEGAVYGSRPMEESMAQALECSRAAVRLDPDDPDVSATAAITQLGAGRIDEAWSEVTDRLSGCSALPWAVGVQGTILQYGGMPGEGRALLAKSLTDAPRDPRNAVFMTQIAISHYAQGDYAAAAGQAQRALARYPEYPIPLSWLAISCAQLGDAENARETLKQAAVRTPATLRRYAHGGPSWMRSRDYQHVLDGLDKAGWSFRAWS